MKRRTFLRTLGIAALFPKDTLLKPNKEMKYYELNWVRSKVPGSRRYEMIPILFRVVKIT